MFQLHVLFNTPLHIFLNKIPVSKISTLQNATIESSELDMIRPSCKATSHIYSKEDYSLCRYYSCCPLFEIRKILLFLGYFPPFTVIPGPLQRVLLCPVDFGKKLVPGMVIKELALEDWT